MLEHFRTWGRPGNKTIFVAIGECQNRAQLEKGCSAEILIWLAHTVLPILHFANGFIKNVENATFLTKQVPDFYCLLLIEQNIFGQIIYLARKLVTTYCYNVYYTGVSSWMNEYQNEYLLIKFYFHFEFNLFAWSNCYYNLAFPHVTLC